MKSAHVSVHPAFVVAPVNRRTFGSFVEHMGRCVYGGIFEPGHPTADEDGFRRDVLDLVQELGVTVVRYPGGNFVSGYRWEDGVGPVADRPTRLDPAWRSIESNAFGLDEFIRWTRKAEVEPMMAVNLGTRGLQEAVDLLEYCNHPGGTALSDLRRSHGAEQPYGVRTWCLGNEMDGPWQLGHKPAAEYGRIAAETARAMRQLDPGLTLVACGSSYRHMPTFGAWEATVLEQTYDAVDHISAHAYYENVGDAASFLASSVNLEEFIHDVVATADHVRAKLSKRKRIDISFDEWNVWYVSRLDKQVPAEWTAAPRISEDAYTVMDAVVVGSLVITLLRHSDRVTTACQAQLVNTISPIRAEPDGPAWRQATFHPFAQAARLARGEVLQAELRSPVHGTAEHGEVPTVDAVVTHDEQTGDLAVLAVNRDQREPVELVVDVRGFPGLHVDEATYVADDDHLAANTVADPDRVRPRRHTGAHVDQDHLRVVLPPVSWNAVRLVA